MAEPVSHPILLFGMPRSGTTWLGKLFDSHPHTLYRHEPDSVLRFGFQRYPGLDDVSEYEREITAFVAGLPAMNALDIIGKQPLFPKVYLSPARARLASAAINVARVGSRLHRDFPVFFQFDGARDPDRRVVWKSIESLGRLGVLLNVLDQARAIHILRHPCGMIASVLRGMAGHRFSDDAEAGSDWGIFRTAMNSPLGKPYNLSDDYLRSLTPEERMAWQWVLINEKALLEAESSARYLCVRYEDVCREPTAQVERMFHFTGLELGAQTRAFIASSTGRERDNYYSVYKNPESAAGRWRHELDAETITRIMAIVRRSRIGQYYVATDDAGTPSP